MLCPAGPLKLLISIAEERNEGIPALVYSAGMASFDDENDPVGGYRTQQSNSSKGVNWLASLPFSSGSSKGYTAIETEEEGEGAIREGVESSNLSVNEMSNLSDHPPPQPSRRRTRRQSHEEEEDDEDDELNAIKLGLGDFIFYSVLIGKAARTDSVTLCLCIFAILTVS